MRWETVDVSRDRLAERFHSTDAVTHLAWLFQPTHDPATTWRTNVLGSIRVFEVAAEAEVPATEALRSKRRERGTRWHVYRLASKRFWWASTSAKASTDSEPDQSTRRTPLLFTAGQTRRFERPGGCCSSR